MNGESLKEHEETNKSHENHNGETSTDTLLNISTRTSWSSIPPNSRRSSFSLSTGTASRRSSVSNILYSAAPTALPVEIEEPSKQPTSKNETFFVYFALVIAQVLWSGFHAMGKFAFQFFSPFVLPSIRAAISVPLFAGLAYYQVGPKFYIIPLRDHVLIAVLAFLGNTAAQQLFNVGLKLSSASDAGMLQPLIPIFTSVFALALRRETANVLKISGILLSIIGCIVMVIAESEADETTADSSGRVLGSLLFVIQTLFTAIYIIGQKPMFDRGFSTFTFTFYIFTYGGFMHLIFGSFFYPSMEWSSLPWTIIPVIAYTSTFATFVSFSCFVYATKKTPASISSLGITLQSVFSPLFGGIFLGEELTFIHVIGGILIIAGMVTVVYSRNRELAQQKMLDELRQLKQQTSLEIMEDGFESDDDKTIPKTSTQILSKPFEDDTDVDISRPYLDDESELYEDD